MREPKGLGSKRNLVKRKSGGREAQHCAVSHVQTMDPVTHVQLCGAVAAPPFRPKCARIVVHIYQIYNVKHLDTSIRMHDKNKTYHNLISLLIKINSKIL